jgi:Uncharacterized protein conserved in bacteria
LLKKHVHFLPPQQTGTSVNLLISGFILLACGSANAGELPYRTDERAIVNSVSTFQSSEPNCKAAVDGRIKRLSPGVEIDEVLTGREKRSYQLALNSGQFAQAVVNQKGIDVSLYVCSPGGELVAEVDRQNGSWGPETVSFLVVMEGVYTLQVRPLTLSAVSGRYSVELKEPRDPTPLDELRVTAEKLVTEAGKLFDKRKPEFLLLSIEKYEQALRLWRRLDEPYEEAIALYGLGWSYSDLGSYGMVKFPLPLHRVRWSYESREAHVNSIRCFEQAFAIMKRLNIHYGQAITRAGLAWPNLYIGKNREALENFFEAWQFFRSTGNKKGEAIAVYGLGWVHAVLNEDQEALDCFSKALPLRREVNDKKGEAITLIGMSRMESRLGHERLAIEHASEAFDIFETQSDTHGMASAKLVIGWAHKALNELPLALTSFQKAFWIQGDNDGTGKAAALYGVAHVLAQQGDLRGALSQMQLVLHIIEPLRERGSDGDLRTYYFANVQEYYEFYIDLLMRRYQREGDPQIAVEALAANEHARARELLAILAETKDLPPQSASSDLGHALSVSEIQSLLDDQTLLLEYFLGKERSYLWLVSSKGVWSYQLPNRAELESRAIRMYDLLASREQPITNSRTQVRLDRLEREKQIEAEAVDLGRLLLEPVAGRLETKRLVIVTQGALQMIPFSALSIPDKRSSTQVFKPIILNHEVIGLPSGSVLKLLRQSASRRRPVKELAIVADPVFAKSDVRVLSYRSHLPDREYGRPVSTVVAASGESDTRSLNQFRRLYGSRWEAQQIASLVPPDQRLLVLDFNANKQRVVGGALDAYRIIHFATHAIINDTDPPLSRIVLSQVDEKGNGSDGDLLLREIYTMRLNAELVVLNACRTGLGPDIKGEGLVGLTSGFMQAGVPRILVSLWSIEDRAAAELMVKFYRRLLGERGLTPALALREVQLEMWRSNGSSSIRQWAAFTLHGDWIWIKR